MLRFFPRLPFGSGDDPPRHGRAARGAHDRRGGGGGPPPPPAAGEVGRSAARWVLVKTAIYGADPNWGRILAAAGAAGVALTVERLTLQAAALEDSPTGGGRAEAVVWTCDLTPDYVRINADYTS